MPHAIRGRGHRSSPVTGSRTAPAARSNSRSRRAFRDLMDSDVGRSRQRLLGWPVARRAGCRLPRAPLHDPTRLRPRGILPPTRANDWVGRIIGVLTLTPYDFWRHSHALHHAELGQSRSPRIRRRRHPDCARVSGVIPMASAPVPAVPASDRDVRHWSDVSVRPAAPTAGGTDAQRLAVLAQHDGNESRHRGSGRYDDLAGRPAVHSCSCNCRSRFSRVRSASGCSMSSTNSRTPSGPMTRYGIFTRRRCTAARIMTCQMSCAGSPPISGFTMSTISAAVSRITGCRECCGITQSLPPSDGLRCLQSLHCVRMVLWDEGRQRLISFSRDAYPRVGDERNNGRRTKWA
jgi:hypothetical protein